MRRVPSTKIIFGLLALLLIALILPIAIRTYLGSQKLQQARLTIGSSQRPAAFRAASQAVAQAARYLPWRVELWEQAGQYALQGGDIQIALNYLHIAASHNRLSPTGHLSLGDAYQANGETTSALREWEAALQSGSSPESVYSRRWHLHRSQGDYQEAIQDLQVLIKLQPADPKLHYDLGLLLATQAPEEALAHLIQAADLDASLAEEAKVLAQAIRSSMLVDDPSFRLLESGRALGRLNEWELAAEAFRQAVRARPDYAEAWAFLGEARQHMGENAEGWLYLEKALSLDPHSLSAHLLMALHWQRREQYHRALAYLKEASDFYPDNPAIQSELGKTLALKGDLEAAFQAYQRACQLAPNDPGYQRTLVEFSLEYNYEVRQVALPAARRAIILSPNDPASADTLGQVFFRLEDLGSAERNFERALRLDPNFAPAHLHLGLVYLYRNNRSAAYERFQRVLTLAAGTPIAEQARRLLENNFP